MKSTLKLFKAVPISERKGYEIIIPDQALLEKTIRKGFVFSPDVLANYSIKGLLELVDIIGDEISLTPEQMNSSFHKSWQKVKDADIEQLVLEQAIHYFTTYGFEDMGMYSEDTVYIPNEELEIPDIDVEEIKLVVIKGYTTEEIKEKLIDLLKSGIALREDTIHDAVDIALFVKLTGEEIESTKNKEVKTSLFDKLNLFPKNPIEFLRHMVYKSTGKTLLIRDKAILEEIKSKDKAGVLDLLTRYDEEYGLKRLARIFLRFKPIFLAFKGTPRMNSRINKIRRLAEIHHRPMPVDYLNNVTAEIKKGTDLDEKMLADELERVNIFRKIRLAYALQFRTQDVMSIVYRIRNGKGYATSFKFDKQTQAEETLSLVLNSIVNDIKPNVEGKKIFIPEYVDYPLPATEKQFTGNLPSGTCISVPKDMIVGIHWNNVDGHRIDLDLSVISHDEKIGWDGIYRTEDRNILFSGDVTDARGKKGASELFYMKRQKDGKFILVVNYYNFDASIEVPTKIMVGKKELRSLPQNYMINPNDVLSVAKTKINRQQRILGLLVTAPHECKFYFAEVDLGRSISSGNSEFVENARQYLFDFYGNTISLSDVLAAAGAEVVHEKEDCDIDLSIENMEKDTILQLLTTKRKVVVPGQGQ